MVSTRSQVLHLLSDGRFHSGTVLGAHLGISRAAVNKAIKSLSDAGLELHRVSGKGYRLPAPFTPLTQDRILAQLGPRAELFRDRIMIVEELDSTSDHLARTVPPAHLHGSVCVAEAQTRGRGRRGRHWVATPWQNVTLSMGWRFDGGPASIAGLSLAAGVAVLRALERSGAAGVGVKWPNDLVWSGRKLAGLLIDVQGEAAGPSQVLLGVGVNVRLSGRDAAAIDQPWVDLEEIRGTAADRNEVVAHLLAELAEALTVFGREGLGPFRDAWQRAHVYHGKPVRIVQPGGEHQGIVEGISETGALRIRNDRGATETYHSGEISLRLA